MRGLLRVNQALLATTSLLAMGIQQSGGASKPVVVILSPTLSDTTGTIMSDLFADIEHEWSRTLRHDGFDVVLRALVAEQCEHRVSTDSLFICSSVYRDETQFDAAFYCVVGATGVIPWGRTLHANSPGEFRDKARRILSTCPFPTSSMDPVGERIPLCVAKISYAQSPNGYLRRFLRPFLLARLALSREIVPLVDMQRNHVHPNTTAEITVRDLEDGRSTYISLNRPEFQNAIGAVPASIPFDASLPQFTESLAVSLERCLSGDASLTIRTEPVGSECRIDRERVGKTPITTSLAAGLHTLSLCRDGFLPFEEEILVGRGDNELELVLSGPTLLAEDELQLKAGELYEKDLSVGSKSIEVKVETFSFDGLVETYHEPSLLTTSKWTADPNVGRLVGRVEVSIDGKTVYSLGIPVGEAESWGSVRFPRVDLDEKIENIRLIVGFERNLERSDRRKQASPEKWLSTTGDKQLFVKFVSLEGRLRLERTDYCRAEVPDREVIETK